MKTISNLSNLIKSVISEIKVIDWASKSEVYNFTLIVFVMLLIFSVFFIVVDYGIMKIISKLLSI